MYFSLIQHPIRTLRNPEMWVQFYLCNLRKVLYQKMARKNLMLEKAKKQNRALDREFIDNETFNQRLTKAIQQKKPFFCCRYGATEITSCFVAEARQKKFVDDISSDLLRKGKTSSGIFPESEQVFTDFANEYRKAIATADYNAYWGSVLMEEYLLNKLLPTDCTLMTMRALEPFQYTQPWTSALKGKKVLVVHPFADQIRSQYEKRAEIFPGKEILPDFELIVVPAIQSSGDTIPEGYEDWHQALDSLTEQCLQYDFEVALLSCGSYAVPLGSRLKEAGKQAIVLGGMLQLVFGIKGKRWEESRPDIVAMYNDAWVRAGEKYAVKNSDKMVDGAAYW